MRALIRQALAGDVTLQGLGLTTPDTQILAGDVDTPQVRPWLNLRWGGATPGLSTVDRRTLTVWVHDTPGDYTRIDSILRRIKQVFASLEGVQHTVGWLTKVEWVTDSDDLTDAGHGTITRTTTHTLIGSGN